jgi:ligand-binding sensor domain-containing protein
MRKYFKNPRLNNRTLYLIGIVLISLWVGFSCKEEESDIAIEEPFEVINAFIIDNQGTKLLATNKGLYTLNTSTGKYNKLDSGIEPAPINDLSIFQNETSDDLWLASYAGALNFTNQTLLTSSNSGLHNTMVNHLNFDNQAKSYFATPSGISILTDEEWIHNIGLDSLYFKFDITDMATATNGYTYATTNGGGVERFKAGLDGISGATVFDTDWTKLKSNNVLTVFIDDTVQAYGTDNGVAMHFSEFTKWDWENYTEVDGLINDTVLSIIKDHSGIWWFGTSRGLSRFDGTEWKNYSKATQEMVSNTIKFLALDVDGTLWFASDAGLSQLVNNQWINYPKTK